MSAVPHVPTVAEYARMSWYARRRLADRNRARHDDAAAATRAEAERLLALITPDEPAVIAARRAALVREVYRTDRRTK